MLAWGLKGNKHLHTLSLAQNLIGPRGTAPLVEALAYNITLRSLSLADNAIMAPGAAALAKLLTVNGAITDLDVSGNQLARHSSPSNSGRDNRGRSGGNKNASAMMRDVSLGLGGTVLVRRADSAGLVAGAADWHGIESFFDAVSTNDALTSLNISDNKLGRTSTGEATGLGVLCLSRAILRNHALVSVDVLDNEFSDDASLSGLHKLGDALVANDHLTCLNGVCVDDATELAIADDSMQLYEMAFVAKRMGRAEALRKLDLSCNPPWRLGVGLWIPGAVCFATSIRER